jgi:hypothetical protein
MNANFKPLGLAAAVAAATAGFSGAANAQVELAAEAQLGDMALVPYYTVRDGYATGLSIINTSNRTQVIKVRLRRAADSMDAMDFNVVLSPEDVYTGTVTTRGDDIVWVSNDNSCVVPDYTDGVLTMPAIFRNGSEEGYIEIISMGSPVSEDAPIAKAARHGSDGIPADCARVRDNFFPVSFATIADYVLGGNAAAISSIRGTIHSALTHQWAVDEETGAPIVGTPVPSTYEASPDSLKVSYFIKSDETGVEFGDNAVHFAKHLDGASMTNQKFGIFDGDFQGYDHPDLNGGAPLTEFALTALGGTPPLAAPEGGTAASRGRYEEVRSVIGASAIFNDWSENQNGPFSVDTDWVVTLPGQYLMTDLFNYIEALFDEDVDCNIGDPADVNDSDPDDKTCDFRDIPMVANFKVIDREERGIIVEEGDLVVSPQPPTPEVVDVLDKEVNIIQWGNSPVLNAAEFVTVPKPEGAVFGWAQLGLTQSAAKTQAICDVDLAVLVAQQELAWTCEETDTIAPVIGFAAWQRNFDSLPAANYGRIVAHSRLVASSDD